MKRALCLLLTITVVSLTGFSNASETDDTDASNNEISLTIMAAASLQKFFAEIADQFSAEHPNSTNDFNYAGAARLVQKLEDKAPADVSASADEENMDDAQAADLIETRTRDLFAENKLVGVVPYD